MKFVVSACLTGQNCKYNGSSNLDPELLSFLRNHEYITVCPEVLGGLPIPRAPSEIKNKQVINNTGIDVTENFKKGALLALKAALNFGAEAAILQPRSPSCGFGQIYDGSFTKTLTAGNGIFTQLLTEHNIKIYNYKSNTENK